MTALTLRLDEAMYEQIRQEAFNRRMSISAVIRERLAAVGDIPEDPKGAEDA